MGLWVPSVGGSMCGGGSHSLGGRGLSVCRMYVRTYNQMRENARLQGDIAAARVRQDSLEKQTRRHAEQPDAAVLEGDFSRHMALLRGLGEALEHASG
jgi:hypothetical protein